MNASDRWDHRHAEEIVAICTGGATESRDVSGAPEGTHDFDLLLNGRRVAVEVTQNADEKRRAILEEIVKRDWHCPELTQSWYVGVDIDSGIRKLHQRVARLLGEMENCGYDRFRPTGHSSNKAVRQLWELGVRAAIRLPRCNPVQVICGTIDDSIPIMVAPRGCERVTTAVKNCAERKIEKLRRANADERHLFLWLDFSDRSTLAALGHGDLPLEPQLPAGLDAVWLAEGLCPGRVLLYRRDFGWVDYGHWRGPNQAAGLTDRTSVVARPVE